MGQKNEKALSDTVQLGDLTLKNRIVMAALTRMRTNPDGIPNQLMVEYYSQRAGCGLILTEASSVCAQGHAFPGAGVLYLKEHVEGWKKVVEAVHKRGSAIFIQLIYCGRANHSILNGGNKVYAPSPIAQRNKIHGTQIDYPVPIQLTLEGIESIKGHFLNAFKLAKDAGFDGIQLHGANGYLIDEFIRSGTNKRKDKYGGSVENRCRFALQLVDLATTVYPSERVCLKLSPTGRYGDMFDQNPVETYSYLLEELSKRKVGSVELVRSEGQGYSQFGHPEPKSQIDDMISTFRKHFTGVLIGNQAYTREVAIEDINNKNLDLVSFGKLALANPDFAQRLINNWELNVNWDYNTFYVGGQKGYIDYKPYQ